MLGQLLWYLVLRLRTAKSLTSSIEGKVDIDRKPISVMLNVELHCLKGRVEEERKDLARENF
jgi:hypothetical protein